MIIVVVVVIGAAAMVVMVVVVEAVVAVVVVTVADCDKLLVGSNPSFPGTIQGERTMILASCSFL